MRKNFGEWFISTLLWGLFATASGLLAFQISSGASTLTMTVIKVFNTDIPIALFIDPLSSIIFVMVSLLAAVIGQYALRYLDGDARQWRFFKFLLVTVIAVCCLVLASNLVMFVAAWLAISWGLHRLLLLHEDRPAAVYAARKKFLVSRLGDAAIIAAVALIYRVFGSFDFGEIFAQAALASTSLSGDKPMLLSIAAILLAGGSLTKSAQFPFHFWLPETMETPTPVSALMHAGVINAGGFLVLRLSPIITFSQFASGMLAIMGAVTAVYGALVMATQNNIKSKLAYSTISQMGMMMFACGIHAYTFALFHIVAHSLYKAHAFLTTASLVEERRQLIAPTPPLGWPTLLFVGALTFSLIVFGGHWENGEHLPSFTYAAVLLLGLSQNTTRGRVSKGSLRILVVLIGSILLYAAIESGLGRFVAIEATSPSSFLVNSVAFFIFAAGLLLASVITAQRSRFSQRIYMWLWNGGYIGSSSTRVLSRIWAA